MHQPVLLLITDLQIGGTPTVVRELAIHLAADPEFDVQVACLDGWGPVADQLRQRSVAVTPLNACGAADVRVVPRLIRLIRRQKIDIVFSFLIHANAVAAVASRFVSGVRFVQSIQTTQPKPRWHWALQNWIQSSAEKIVAPSPSVADAAMRWAGVDGDRIVVIPNAVEIGDFEIEPPAQPGQRVGFIGRLDPIKRVQDLIAAMSFLDGGVTLHIFGQGEEEAAIRSEIRRLGLQDRVSLHGVAARPQDALAKIDLLILPSDAEGFGLVLIEAMAAGVPVIGTNVAGIRDVIEPGVNGLLVPARQPKILAGAIARLLGDKGLRAKLVAAGRQRVRRKYDWSVVIEEYKRLLTGGD